MFVLRNRLTGRRRLAIRRPAGGQLGEDPGRAAPVRPLCWLSQGDPWVGQWALKGCRGPE